MQVEPIREMLVVLREDARISQAELAKRLPFTASRVSRVESGEIGLTPDDAVQIAEAIGTPKAKSFAEYIGQEWRIIERPGFSHISRETLWSAEQALQRLEELEDDPELKNAFLQQVNSCKLALQRSAFGSPGVGKTTAICVLSALAKVGEKELRRKMVLPTGSGRTTICEVHVRDGGEYSIIVDPCSTEEIRQYVGDLCEHLIASVYGNDVQIGTESPGISAEVERALRNMAGLTKKTSKGTDRKIKREDPALDLVKLYPTKEDLQVQILSRLELTRRTAKSVSMPRGGATSGLEWLARAFADINDGKNSEFSLPRRIEVTVPYPIFGTNDLDLRLIDTRGIDEPSAPRRDVQSYLDEERTIPVFCSSFKDAPDAAMLALLNRAAEGGLGHSVADRGILLVLPVEGEESGVRDNISGDAEEGREIRREQVTATLRQIKNGALKIEFLNAANESDCNDVRKALLTSVDKIRLDQEQQLRTLISTVDTLITNKANEQTKAIFNAAIRPLRVWFANNQELPTEAERPAATLLEKMAELRYVSSLRASVNRYGNWYNFDYWHSLGFGARSDVVARSADQVTKLRGLIETSLNDPDFSEVHDFLRHFQKEVEAELIQFYQDVQTLGETAFLEQLREDHDYWNKCSARWGGGPGYKGDLMHWTNDWFSEEDRLQRDEFIEKEVENRWQDLIGKLDQQVASIGTQDLLAVANPA